MTDTIAIILARGGSKGLARKNLQPLDGVPLVVRPIQQALAAETIDVVLVSTDDEEIAEVARDAGAEVPFLRPSDDAQDLTTTEASLQYALTSYEAHAGRTFDIGVFITATDIFRDPAWIDECVRRLDADDELESVFVGWRTHKNFWERNDDGTWQRLKPWMSVYSSRQVRRFVVREDTGLACASRAWLWREGRRIGDRVDIVVTDDDFTGIDIHGAEDLRLAQAAIDIRKDQA